MTTARKIPTRYDEIAEKMRATDEDRWLGRLCWYSVSEVTIGHKKLAAALHRHGLTGYIPRAPSDVDVFKRVTTSASKRRVLVPTSVSGATEIWCNYLVRDLPSTPTHVQKVLVRETVNDDNLEYETELVRFELEKATGDLSIQRSTGGDRTATEIADWVVVEYTNKRGTMNSYAVRELLRRIIGDLHGTNVRGKGGGVYFVSQVHGDVLDRVSEFATSMPGTVLFHSLPLIDDGTQRDMVRRAFESETVDEIERLVLEIQELTSSGKTITAERATVYTTALKDLKAKTEEYETLLSDTTGKARSGIKLFQRQVLKVMSLVVS